MPTHLELAPMSYAYEDSSRATRDIDREGLTNRRQRLIADLGKLGIELEELGRDFRPDDATDVQHTRMDLAKLVARMKEAEDQVREIDNELAALDR